LADLMDNAHMAIIMNFMWAVITEILRKVLRDR
jgi:hypothetical protein